MAKQLLIYKIDSKINHDTLIALENYMAVKGRNKSDAIRILLIQSLETERQLEKVNCVHEWDNSFQPLYRTCNKCGLID